MLLRLFISFIIFFSTFSSATNLFTTDTIKTSAGDLKITFLGHASLLFNFAGKSIYVDPYSKVANYQKLPKADLILITHEHPDHLDPGLLKVLCVRSTKIIVNPAGLKLFPNGLVMKNGYTKMMDGLEIDAVPAYNIVHKRPGGYPYHPKGQGNGYVLTFGDKRIYIAGDTENIPEMHNLRNIYCAFLPMNLPYTMTPEMVVAAGNSFQPKILYPYHYGDTAPQRLLDLLRGRKDIEIRIRNLS